jgi:hypothetical protein
MKLWPPSVVKAAYDALVILWPEKDNPDSFRYKWLCLIPKKGKSPTIYANLRPLMLIEALRKLWIELSLEPVISLWHESNLFSTDQHGSTRGCGTYSAIFDVLAIMEEAEELGAPLQVSSLI